MFELVRSLDDDEPRAGDEVMILEYAIGRSLCCKVLSPVGEAYRKRTQRQVRLIERQIRDPVRNLIRDTVPNLARLRGSVLEGLKPAGELTVMQLVQGLTGNAQLLQRPHDRSMRLLNKLEDLEFLGGRGSHSSYPPSAIMLFLNSSFPMLGQPPRPSCPAPRHSSPP